jgi:zinc protease
MRASWVGLALAVSGTSLAQPPPIEERALDNGLTVLVLEDHSLPIVTVEIGVRNGSMNESPEYNGLSHLYEHMFFKGNQVFPTQEAFLAKTRLLGMVFNGGTETERVDYYFTTTSDQLLPSLTLMRDSIQHPLFDPAEMKREQQVVVGEIDRNDSEPFYHLRKDMDALLWKYPSYKDPLGNRATVLAATPAMMRTIQERYYVPNNAVLVVSGDVVPNEVFHQAEVLFGSWPRAPDPFLAHPLVAEPPLHSSRVVVVTQAVETVSLAFEWQGPSVVPAQYDATYAADLLSVLVEQPGSRFQRALVDSGACVHAQLSWFTQRQIGPVSYFLEAAPDKVEACLGAARAQLPRLTDPDAFSDREMENAVTTLELERALERESSSAAASLVSFWWATAGLDYYRGYLDHIRRVTRAQIASFLHEFVLDRPFVFGALVSPELAREQKLDEARFEKLLGLPASPGTRP